jgi:hypothetical protein
MRDAGAETLGEFVWAPGQSYRSQCHSPRAHPPASRKRRRGKGRRI